MVEATAYQVWCYTLIIAHHGSDISVFPVATTRSAGTLGDRGWPHPVGQPATALRVWILRGQWPTADGSAGKRSHLRQTPAGNPAGDSYHLRPSPAAPATLPPQTEVRASLHAAAV